jgi:CRP/FNR family transcriptional regulator, cyclic AMP receptor protein
MARERVTINRAVGDALAEVAPPTRPRLGREGAALLKQAPLFACLSARQLRRVAASAEEVRYGPRRTVVREGARGDSFYVIAEGTATVQQGSRTIATLGPGDFFGEMSLLDGDPRSASVIAATPLRTVRVARSGFHRVLDTDPSIARTIMVELAGRIRRLESPPSPG